MDEVIDIDVIDETEWGIEMVDGEGITELGSGGGDVIEISISEDSVLLNKERRSEIISELQEVSYWPILTYLLTNLLTYLTF